MSSHTPGPWHIDVEQSWPADAPCFITAGSGGPLCIVDNREDACLIAAAPEMLKALEDLLEYGIGAPVEKTQQAIAAIAKARGEE